MLVDQLVYWVVGLLIYFFVIFCLISLSVTNMYFVRLFISFAVSAVVKHLPWKVLLQ